MTSGGVKRGSRSRLTSPLTTFGPARETPFTRLDGGATTMAASRDGGIIWPDVIFPQQHEMGDPIRIPNLDVFVSGREVP